MIYVGDGNTVLSSKCMWATADVLFVKDRGESRARHFGAVLDSGSLYLFTSQSILNQRSSAVFNGINSS